MKEITPDYSRTMTVAESLKADFKVVNRWPDLEGRGDWLMLEVTRSDRPDLKVGERVACLEKFVVRNMDFEIPFETAGRC